MAALRTGDERLRRARAARRSRSCSRSPARPIAASNARRPRRSRCALVARCGAAAFALARDGDRLEPYRRARFVLDAELLTPGSAPGDRAPKRPRSFDALGAAPAAAICERSATEGWNALASYPRSSRRRSRGDRAELFAAVGHPEAELVVRGADGERRLAALRAAAERLAKFAASELPMLIGGESGTGKELAARHVHRASRRAGQPFVAVNCAALSETLILSDLFGHARGAFTGADQPRAGYFETARAGTLFLDEIGDLPLVAQGSLLRVLQEGEIRRLGESLPRKVDVRVVAATNRDLETMVEQGSFRQDLYFRLKAATVVLPPLRERGQDVLLLAERFVDEIRARGRDLRLTPEARRALVAHSWPGNVRELKNALAAAAILAEAGAITPEHLDLAPVAAPAGEGDYHRQVEEFRVRLVRRALEAADGSLAGAARQLGVTRQFLSQFVRKHGLQVTR
jgi:transcriptional regulator of acetoin/glycerol metabolism